MVCAVRSEPQQPALLSTFKIIKRAKQFVLLVDQADVSCQINSFWLHDCQPIWLGQANHNGQASVVNRHVCCVASNCDCD